MAGLKSGRKLMKQWGIRPHELLHRFIKKGFIVYDETGQEVSPEEALYNINDDRSDAEKIMAWQEFELPGSDTEAEELANKLNNVYFDEGNAQEIEETFDLAGKKKSYDPNKQKPSDKHPRVRHRNQARAVAKDLWDKYPDMSLTEMANNDEVLKVSKKSNDKLYLEKSVKGWIRNLNPNPPQKGCPKKKDK